MKHLVLLMLLAVPAAAQEPAGTIRFPVLPAPVVPAPAPGVPSKLASSQWYVIDADVPLLVWASPAGLVSINEEAGPMKVKGWFVDSAKPETRTFKGKHLYFIEAVGTGRVELIVSAVGAAKASDAIRKTLDVDAQNPQPPPDPKPDPKPSPAPIPLAGLRVLFIIEEQEPDKLTAGQRAILYGKPMRDWLNSKCVMGKDGKTKEWRIWDKDVPTQGAEKHWQDVMQRRPASVPWIIVSNHPRGGYEGPLPASVEETKALIQKYME